MKTHLPSVVILIRHGETIKMNSEKRGLTGGGKKKIKEVAGSILGYKVGTLGILCSKKRRARETAMILEKNLDVERLIFREVRIVGVEKLVGMLEKKSGGQDPISYYLAHDLSQLLIESSHRFMERFKADLLMMHGETVLVVSHSISLEVILKLLDEYVLINKTFDKHFDYGDFAVLVKRKISIQDKYGSSNARHFSKCDIPVLMTKPTGGKIHGSDEYISLSACEQYYFLLESFLKEYEQKLKGGDGKDGII